MNEHSPHCEDLVADCRLRAATDLFAHTWDPVVLAALRPGPRRRRDLRVGIGGVSDKVLTEALRRLGAHGLVDRRAFAAAPARVEYALTDLGRSLVDGPMKALGRWVLDRGDELLDAQARQHPPGHGHPTPETDDAVRRDAGGGTRSAGHEPPPGSSDTPDWGDGDEPATARGHSRPAGPVTVASARSARSAAGGGSAR